MPMHAATLEILEKADLPPKQARAIAQAIEIEVAAGHSTLATRADLLGTQHGLELKMSEHKSELVRWVFLCILGQSATLLGVGYFLFSHLSA
jgi:hypothetical protein